MDTVSRFGIKEQTWLKDPREIFCVLGYLSAAFVVAVTTEVRSLLTDALRLFAGNQDLDISSSSIWPISYWDLALNLGRGRRGHLQPMSGLSQSFRSSSFIQVLIRDGRLGRKLKRSR